jgi:predicted RNase H-like HicB family nuclease
VKEFVALIRQRSDGGYCVPFPDLPTVTVDGATLEHARAQAEIALLLHIPRAVAEGEAIPEPSGSALRQPHRQSRPPAASIAGGLEGCRR